MPGTHEPHSLSAFIQRNHRDIIGEFSAFARTLMPPNSPMTDQELRDHCEELLVAIAEGPALEKTSPALEVRRLPRADHPHAT